MPLRVRALVKPELLLWARGSCGLSVEQAARRLAIPTGRLQEWEAGESRPTINQLRSLARIYKRPIAVFYLPEAPRDFRPMMHDFRRLPGDVPQDASPDLLAEIRRAEYRRDIAVELYRDAGEEPPQFTATTTLDQDPEEVGIAVRQVLAVDVDMQKGWSTEYEAVNGWRKGLEGAGVLVFQASGIELHEMRGFSIGGSPLPVVVVNIKDAPRGRIFSMLHELCHVMLHAAGICTFTDERTRPPEEQRVEVFCNRVAGAALLPRDVLLNDDRVQGNAGPTWTDSDLVTLARRYQVSREVVLRRLLILGRTTEEFYRVKRRQFEQEYAERAARQTSGFAPPHVVAVSRAGPLFTMLVLGSYHGDRITSSSVSEFLDVKLKHLPRIEQLVYGRSLSGMGGG